MRRRASSCSALKRDMVPPRRVSNLSFSPKALLNTDSGFMICRSEEREMIRAGRLRRRAGVLLIVTIAAATVTAAGQQSPKRPYFPPRGEWQKKDPSAAGLDKAKLDDAIAFAVAHENPNTKDLSVAIVNQFRAEAPYNTLIGPTQPRAGANGVIIRHGTAAAAWGEP